MKKWLSVLALGALFVGGCATKTGTGAIAGGALGAGTGAIIGGKEGALIGGAVGAIGGGLVGAALDEQDRKIMNKTSPATVEKMDRGDPITIYDVIKLSQGGVSDDTIINYIHESGTKYNLNQGQINKLKEGGVSQRVINYMVKTGQ